jgi:hypothetical protein
MVWTPELTGEFLDHAINDELYPLFHLIALRGLRRGEACGLPWTNVDLTAATITVDTQIIQLGWETQTSTPKSDCDVRSHVMSDHVEGGSTDVVDGTRTGAPPPTSCRTITRRTVFGVVPHIPAAPR